MDGSLFDKLVRGVADEASRRRLLSAVVAVMVGSAFGLLRVEETLAACKRRDMGCRENPECCSRKCQDGRCACSRRRQKCTRPEDCCSGHGPYCKSNNIAPYKVCCGGRGDDCVYDAACCGSLLCRNGRCR